MEILKKISRFLAAQGDVCYAGKQQIRLMKGTGARKSGEEDFVSGNPDGEETRKITMEEAQHFLKVRRDASAKIASGVAACILSPVLLLFLGGAAESGMLDMSEDLAAGIGMMAVLLIVAGAVASFLIFGREMGKYEYLEKEIFELSYGIEGMVREKSEAYAPVFTVKISCGIALCIFGFIPLMLVDGLWGTEMAEIGSFIFLLICAAMTFIMSKTKFGTRVYLVGTNEKAARFAGIHCNKILIQTYLLSGLISGVAGLLSLARLNSAKADFGSSYTMQCILIAVLGGVNPNGGFGTIPGITIAVIILQMISSYLNMFPSISNYYRNLIWGVALIGVLIMNFVLDKRRTQKLSKAS